MKPELEELKITEKQLEKISGLDVNEVFVGGVLGGVYRPSIFRNHKRLFLFYITETIFFLLTFVFSIPFGLFITRKSTVAIKESAIIIQFLEITLGITLAVMIGWNFYMRFAVKRLKTLMHLLDEVDKYNEILQAVDILDRLEAVRNSQVNLINRNEVVEALKVTRNSLISGLMTEKILRESRELLARRYDLLANIENNLTTLRTLEVNEQANEYGQLLNEALQIGMSVHKEVQKFSR